jgi:hypothetical protein
MKRTMCWILAAGLLATLGGCAVEREPEEELVEQVPPREAGADALQLTSPAFAHGGELPVRFTCRGAAVTPPLEWSNVPADARTLALFLRDEGGIEQRDEVLWAVYNLPASSGQLPAGARPEQLPSGAVSAANSLGRQGAASPCPETERHSYVLQLFALDTELSPDLRSYEQVEDAMEGHVLAAATLETWSAPVPAAEQPAG